MQIENNNNPNQQQQQAQQPQLPYQPIKFVYTQTIGSLDEKFRQIIDPYTWAYEDLLQPKIVYGKSKIQYYLFHVAPIYNWLRHVGSGMLAQYVSKIDQMGNKINNNSTKGPNLNNFSNNKNILASYTPFSHETWKFQMKHYIAQWQIAKLCATAKIKIITTRTQNNNNRNKLKNNNQNNKQNNKPFNNNKDKLQQQLLCTHLIKKDKFSSDYILNTIDLQLGSYPRLQCQTAYCTQCQRDVNIKSQIIKYPFAPYFNKYYGKQFTIITNQSQQTKSTYQLVIVYCNDKVYLKSSGGVWYEILFKENKKSIVSFDRIQYKGGLVFVYQQQVNNKGDKVLRKAEPVKVEQTKKQQKGLVDLAKFISKQKDNDDSEDQVEDHKQKILQKTKQLTVVNKAQQVLTQLSQHKLPINQPIQQQQQQDNQPLEDMSKNPLPIVLNKKKTQRKLFKQYKKTVESLLPKPKQKDQYQKQYDKGKTKKIHKNRQQFRTADFFSLYNKLKGGPQSNTDTKRVSKTDGEGNNEEMKDQNNAHAHGQNKRRSNDDNDDYNDIYQGKRSDRFNERRGGGFRGRVRVGRFGDRDNRGGRDGERGGGRGRGGSRGRGRDGDRGGSRGRGRGGFKNFSDGNRNGTYSSRSQSNNNKYGNRNKSNGNHYHNKKDSSN